MRFFKFSIFTLLICLGFKSFSHNPEELIILDIEQGQLTFQDEQVSVEYQDALKRQRMRRLAAMLGLERFSLFIKAGIQHIIPKGLDHILFVLGLFFYSIMFRPLLWQVTAFTLAHTITLALATTGLVNVPSAIVEPLIALSIVWIAIENCLFKKTSKWRPFIIFGFGLLHGLGFASVLGQYGLPKASFLPSLLAFNIGVEIGQLSVLLVAIALVWFIRKKSWYRKWVQMPASLIIAAVGLFWFVERVI